MNTAPTDADDVAAMIKAFGSELAHPEGRLSLLVRFEVDKDDAAKVETAFARATPPTRDEPGCILYALNRAPKAAGRFVMFEQWRSVADLEAHLRTGHFAELRTTLGELLIGTPAFEVLLPAG
jgi:quinol monooxygenase YgiN